ncbi:MAG TPA: hypothetical protein VGY55_10150 [Pirellulales bacterium]|nr:hypothetical protein [Pirellulales bacterium]
MCGSALLWYASFWVFRLTALMWVNVLRMVEVLHRGFDGSILTFYIAIGCTLVLAVEGFRRSLPVFDLIEFHDSAYFSRHTSINSGSARGLSDAFAEAWLLSQFLFSAPRVTIISVAALRSVVSTNREIVEQAAFILTKLKEDRRWTAPTDFGECAQAVKLLRRLNLIWIKSDGEEFSIRCPAGMSEAEIEA